MKMTDDNREFIFNDITRWLRDSNFVISEEKITVVTSDFYAKALSSQIMNTFLKYFPPLVSRHVSCCGPDYTYLNNN